MLDAPDIVPLHLVSKRLFKIARDNEIWRKLCFDNSYSETTRRRRELYSGGVPIPVPDPPVLELQRRAAAALSANNDEAGSASDNSCAQGEELPSRVDAERTRAMANWDPSYPTEKVDWHGEYIARHAPISMSWLQQPTGGTHRTGHIREIRGLGYLHNGSGSQVVAPLDDGSVCLWDVNYNNTTGGHRRGTILGRSKPGLLSVNGADKEHAPDPAHSKAKMTSTGVVECVSVDSARNKAYFAVQSCLNEVDLETLQISSHERYPFSISALSEACDPVPLTIGTTLSLHLHDPRQARNSRSPNSSTDRVESVANFPTSPRVRNDFYRLLSGDPPPEYAPLFQPGPLSILHLASNGTHDATSGEIYVGGRFPSILTYDRRCFPKLRNTIHSGARISSLTSSPFPFKALESDLMRQNQLSIQAVHEAKSQTGKTLVACGEYNGKGSLEMYGMVTDADLDARPNRFQAGASQNSTYKNRVSASRSKLLSVSTHGTRLVFSDSDGQIKWIERDGSTLVRRWNINQYQAEEEQQQHGGLFPLSVLEANAGDVARKIVPTNGNAEGGHVDRDELLVWTGERVGLLGFKSKPAFGEGDWEEADVESVEEKARRKEERIYGQTMRRALQRQADEVRFVKGFGLGLGMGTRF